MASNLRTHYSYVNEITITMAEAQQFSAVGGIPDVSRRE